MSYELEKDGDFKRTCHICGTEYDIRGTDELHESDEGNTICEYCINKVVEYSLSKMFHGRFYGYAEHEQADISTGWHTTRKEAKDALFDMIEKLWSGIDKVEVD